MKRRIRVITVRLKPGRDLRDELERLVKKSNIRAGCVLSMVGSLQKVSLRMAGGKTVKAWNRLCEIVSVTGTVSVHGCHVHIAVSDAKGNTFGGHLKNGCVVKTTVELVILVFDGVEYRRALDRVTGYRELVVNSKVHG